jgi:hypothetical protein
MGFIGDDGEGRNFASGPGSGRDADEFALPPEFRILEGPFADIHELLLEVIEIDFRMLIEDPHAFGGIHAGASAEGDDGIGLKLFHDRDAFTDGRDIGIGLHFSEELIGDGVSDAD